MNFDSKMNTLPGNGEVGDPGGMAPRILLVEDDDRIRETTRILLEDEGYIVDEACTGEEALARLPHDPADCVLLDIMLPGRDGFETCREIRRHSLVPIIMVTARTDTFDVVAGLEAGADDYITKPFEPKELSARIRANVRRSRAQPAVAAPPVRFGDLSVGLHDGTVRRGDEEIHLTRTEFRILSELARVPGGIVSRESLLQSVWGYEHLPDSKLVEMHIHRLRLKVEPDPGRPRYILTARGRGYRMGH